MKPQSHELHQVNLLEPEEASRRVAKICDQLTKSGADAMLVGDNANIFYLTGRVYAGYVYVERDGRVCYFVRRPVGLRGENVSYIRKPEQIPDTPGFRMPGVLGLELDHASYSDIERLKRVFPDSKIENASTMLARVRSVKTRFEIEMIAASGVKQERVYRRVPRLYHSGMTDLELQIEIERVSRLEGCLGQFRICGNSMELYMGNILVGQNADTPTPYDFAMGGEGLDPSLPVGANGSIIRNTDSVMVDVNGNYTGYMTDMTRTFAVEQLKELAQKAHQCSIDICRAVQSAAQPGAEARSLYKMAEDMAKEAGLGEYFMGHRQKAGFVGHGVGIEINELPVIAPRSRDVIEVGNVFALEPKFVIPGTGAVGIENTYVVEDESTRCLTNAPEQITFFE